VMRHVLGRYLGLDIPENRRPLDLYPLTYRDVFPHRLGCGRVAKAGMRSLTQWWHNRSVTQVGYSSSAQMTVGYELRGTSPGTASRLHRFASDQGATVHDVFLAALGRAVAEFLPRRSKRGDARELALGTIVDTRGDAAVDLSESLGAFLAYYLVRCCPDSGGSLAHVTRRVAAVTKPIKAGRSYFDALVNMQLVNAIWPWLGEATRPHFMRKALPVAAGISNVRLREPWMDRQARGRILGYSRAASCGPNLPLVVTPTTFNEELNVGFTYRVTGFTRPKLDGIIQRFLEQIENPSEGRTVRPSRRANREIVWPSLPDAAELADSAMVA
jgi:hypothetical protein